MSRVPRCVAGALIVLVSVTRPHTMRGQSPLSTATPSGAISGVVVDATSGRPLPNAIVVIGAPGTMPAQRLLTDAKGRFVVRNIPPSSGYELSATKQGYFGGGGTPVAVGEGQWVADRRIALIRHGVIAGTVVDENGEPVVAAPVRLLVRIMIAGHARLASGPLVKTDDRGMYRISGLRDGRYFVEVLSIQNVVPRDPSATTVDGQERSNAPAHYRDDPALDLDAANRLVLGTYPRPPLSADGPTAYPITFHPGATMLADAAEIELAEGQQREGVDIQLRPQRISRVQGRVDASAGTATGMVLRLAPVGLEDMAISNETATTVVDRTGRFTFLNVPDGRYVLDGRSSFGEYSYSDSGFASLSPLPTPGFAVRSSSSGSIPSAAGQLSFSTRRGSNDQMLAGRTELTVASRDITDVVLPMTPGVSVSGRVVFGDGVEGPRGFTFISVQAADGSPALAAASAQVSQDAFTIAGVRPGRYVIRSSLARVRSIVVNGKDVTKSPIDIGDADVNDVVVTLTGETISLTGRALGLPSDTPAAVMVFPVDRALWTSYGFQAPYFVSAPVATSGTFRLSVLSAGDYYVVAVPFALRNQWQDPKFLERTVPSATMVSLNWGDTKSVDAKFAGDSK
jgi:hypothetical protein